LLSQRNFDVLHRWQARTRPLVFDATAREIKQMAPGGLIQIVNEQARDTESGPLIERLAFRRLRQSGSPRPDR
jgi:hypothetical protein